LIVDNFLTPCISLSIDPARKGEAGWIGGKNQEYQTTNELKQCLFRNEIFFSRSRHAKNITTGIYLIFRGLFFEHNPSKIGFAFHRAGAEIGQKDRS